MRVRTFLSLLALVSLSLLAGCSTAPDTEEGRENLHEEVNAALNRFERADPELKDFLDRSIGYAMFPSVGKAGFGLGAAYGQGEAFENGERIGSAAIRQGSLGLQAGAQEFDELVVFGTREAMDKFKNEKLEFGANASAIVLKSGAAKAASFRDGVAVFTDPKGGAMVELSISGQQFTYRPLERERRTERTTERRETERRETTEERHY